MTEIKSISEAFDYVNQRYVFNSENYPVMTKLNADEQKAFALKHTLLHILKSFTGFAQSVRSSERNNYRTDALHEDLYKICVPKILVNLLKMADVAGIKSDEIVEKAENVNLLMSSNTDAVEIHSHLMKIASACERFDHTGEWDDRYNVEQAVCCMLHFILGKIEMYSRRISLQDVLKEIPVVMESK